MPSFQQDAESAFLRGSYRYAADLFIRAAQHEATTHEGAMVLVERASDALFQDMLQSKLVARTPLEKTA